MMHVRHDFIQQDYMNSEIIFDDALPNVPRTNLRAIDDGYAWDMDKLAQAITSNGGIVRNPLSKQMFIVPDIRAIVQHPLCK